MAMTSRIANVPLTMRAESAVRCAGVRTSATTLAAPSTLGSAAIARISPSTRPLSALTRPPTARASPVTTPPLYER